MNRVLMILREQRAGAPPATDRELLDRFRAARDGAAFAELVRRYGPLVWGACRRRLTNAEDAEDAFQATFLVLLRRAERLNGTAPLGPWLYQVAVMTARNVVRGNRRRAAVTGPMGHEVPAPEPGHAAEHPDLDAALLALPERDRAAVVLCHLQGLTRREAAERLGCPEGTLSARLNRAMQRLRARLGGGAPVVLAAPAVTLPAGLASATVRSATIYSTSALGTVGVSPAVVGLTDGVLHMIWMKKVMTAAVAAVLVVGAGAFALGTAGRSENVARATEPLRPGAPPAAPQEADPLKRVEKQLADLEKQKLLLDMTLEGLKTEKKKLEDAKREKEAEADALDLGRDIAVSVGESDWPRPYLVREVVNGRVAEMTCSNLDLLTTYLARVHNDPKGPKKLRISANQGQSMDELGKVFAACAAAGYATAAFSHNERPVLLIQAGVVRYHQVEFKIKLDGSALKPGEIDLRQWAAPKKP